MLKLKEVRELTEENIKETVVYLGFLQDLNIPYREEDELLKVLIKKLADIYKEQENIECDRAKSAYLLYDRLQ